MKKALSLLLSVLMILSVIIWPQSSGITAEAASFTDMSQSQIVDAMGLGWNLGNQLEANLNGTPSETAWGNPTITSTIFKAIKSAGFDTVRIPVSWLSYIGSAPNYTIDSSWMARVKQVVDLAIAEDLYVVINVHGDGYSSVTGGWILPGSSDQSTIKAKFSAVWTQIATTFKSYDHHLIFEGMNEIGADANYDWATVYSWYNNINAYNQLFVDAVRATGGNNTQRWLIVTGWNTNIDYTASQDQNFVLPTDSYNSSPRIMVSVHYYSPWEFCGDESYNVTGWGSSSSSNAGWGNEDYMVDQLAAMYNRFVSAGYPVFIGEFGCVNKNNTSSRVYWAKTFCQYSKQYGCIPVWWDNGWNGDFGFALFDRSTGAQTHPDVINAMVGVYGGSGSATTATTTKATTTTAQTTTSTKATTTTTKATTAAGSSSNADNYVITINGVSSLKYIVVNGYHLSVADGSGTYWENAAVTGGSATVLVPKANAYSLTIDFKSEQWGSVIASWSGDINSDITLTFNGSSVSASAGSSSAATTTKATTTTTTTKAPTTTTTTRTTTTTTTTRTTTTTTTTKATTTTKTTTTTKATTTTTKATTAAGSSSNADNYVITIKTSGNGSSLMKYLMVNGYHLAIGGTEGTYWENTAVSGTVQILVPKANAYSLTIEFKSDQWGSSLAKWSGDINSDITLTFNGSTVTQA